MDDWFWTLMIILLLLLLLAIRFYFVFLFLPLFLSLWILWISVCMCVRDRWIDRFIFFFVTFSYLSGTFFSFFFHLYRISQNKKNTSMTKEFVLIQKNFYPFFVFLFCFPMIHFYILVLVHHHHCFDSCVCFPLCSLLKEFDDDGVGGVVKWMNKRNTKKMWNSRTNNSNLWMNAMLCSVWPDYFYENKNIYIFWPFALFRFDFRFCFVSIYHKESYTKNSQNFKLWSIFILSEKKKIVSLVSVLHQNQMIVLPKSLSLNCFGCFPVE